MPCEFVAIRRVQQINTAEPEFLSQRNRYGIAEELDLPALNTGRCDIAHSYAVQLHDGGYSVQARPRGYSNDGHRSFYSDQTFVITQAWDDGPAGPSDPELR